MRPENSVLFALRDLHQMEMERQAEEAAAELARKEVEEAERAREQALAEERALREAHKREALRRAEEELAHDRLEIDRLRHALRDSQAQLARRSSIAAAEDPPPKSDLERSTSPIRVTVAILALVGVAVASGSLAARWWTRGSIPQKWSLPADAKAAPALAPPPLPPALPPAMGSEKASVERTPAAAAAAAVRPAIPRPRVKRVPSVPKSSIPEELLQRLKRCGDDPTCGLP